MKQILYGGGTFVTCDHVAAELLEYGVELAGHGLAASVDFPILLADGSASIGTVLLGPASQFVVMPDDTDSDLDCGDAVETIKRHRRELAGPPRTGTWNDVVDSSMIDPV